MAWHAKPSGGYLMSSVEGTENIYEMHYMFDNAGYTIESQAGIVGNVYNESALNVWRWQGDSVNLLYGGYGLFQYTASTQAATDRYIQVCSGLPYYAPNLSTTGITSGALPTDAICQVNVFLTDYLQKWNPYIWRSYWPADATLRAKVNSILSRWGNGTTLTLAQFSQITNIEDATIAFLGAFEGPAVPNWQSRVTDANAAYQILTGAPPGPTPAGRPPIWLLFKLKERYYKQNGYTY